MATEQDSETSNGTATPETNGTHTPTTPKPKHTALALTEYSANPSPPPKTPNEKPLHAGVPGHLLLPNGHPDVSHLSSRQHIGRG